MKQEIERDASRTTPDEAAARLCVAIAVAIGEVRTCWFGRRRLARKNLAGFLDDAAVLLGCVQDDYITVKLKEYFKIGLTLLSLG